MPSLPRIRRLRARGGLPVLSPAPVVHELTASGLTWVNVVSPDVETSTGPRDALRLAPPRRRGHRLEAPATEGRRLRGRGLSLRGPPLPLLRQPSAEAQCGRAGHLRRTRLRRHHSEPRATAGHAPVLALRGGRPLPRAALRARVGSPPVRDPRRSLRLLLPDPRQDRPQARRDRGRDVRGQGCRRSSATSPT